jgi:hypothetical protein
VSEALSRTRQYAGVREAAQALGSDEKLEGERSLPQFKAGPATIDHEGLADVTAANPFRLPRLHPGIRWPVVCARDCVEAPWDGRSAIDFTARRAALAQRLSPPASESRRVWTQRPLTRRSQRHFALLVVSDLEPRRQSMAPSTGLSSKVSTQPRGQNENSATIQPLYPSKVAHGPPTRRRRRTPTSGEDVVKGLRAEYAMTIISPPSRRAGHEETRLPEDFGC